jgi:hypothetical protein
LLGCGPSPPSYWRARCGIGTRNSENFFCRGCAWRSARQNEPRIRASASVRPALPKEVKAQQHPTDLRVRNVCFGAIVLKNSKTGPDEKARQIESQRHVAVRHYLSPAADLARCRNAKSAGPPANLLNAASVGLPGIEHRRKESFSTKSRHSGPSRASDEPTE